jgi:hypothetical protein
LKPAVRFRPLTAALLSCSFLTKNQILLDFVDAQELIPLAAFA